MKRQFALIVALVTWFALVVQLVVSIRTGIARGNGWTYGLWMYVAFFTVTTNLLVAVASLLVAVGADSPRARKLCNSDALTGIAASIILVAVTYNAILAGMWKPQGWQLVADLALHDIVPILFVVFWWVAVPRGSVRFAYATRWALYPIAYFTYAMIRGVATGFYPYPFINVRELGFFWVVVNALGVLLAFFIILAALTAAKVSFRASTSPETAA